jgi:hypothetical protein
VKYERTRGTEETKGRNKDRMKGKKNKDSKKGRRRIERD